VRPTSDLHAIARREGIIVRYYQLPDEYDGYYLHPEYPPVPHIIINERILDDVVRFRATYSHELGHHFTLGGALLSAARSEYTQILHSKWEAAADRWAINFMVRLSDLLPLLKQGYPTWEIAEKLLVPEQWVVDRIKRLKGVTW